MTILVAIAMFCANYSAKSYCHKVMVNCVYPPKERSISNETALIDCAREYVNK